jgi:hypothetical protein
MSLSLKPSFGKRPLITMAYIANAMGVLKPNKPLKCPSSSDGDPDCSIYIERWRHRVCGISFPLAGMHCETHDTSFTVYPPGWTPYARSPLVLVDHNGHALEPEATVSRWVGTVFEAAVDASNEILWPEELELGPTEADDCVIAQSRRTQRRHVAGVMRLFGFNRSATLREREVVASLTGVGVTKLEEGARKIREGPTLVLQGLEAVQVLEQLPVLRIMMTGLLTLGVNQGYWGPALLQ